MAFEHDGDVEDAAETTSDEETKDDEYARNYIPNLRVKAMPDMMMEGQVPLIYVLYIQNGLELMFLALFGMIFLVLHSPIWWIMFLIVVANFIQTVRHLTKLEWFLEFDIQTFKKKMRIMLVLDILCLIFWTFQDKWSIIIRAEYRGEGLSMPILLLKFFCSDFFCVYATWSYVARKHGLLDEDGVWIKSKKELKKEREQRKGQNLQAIWKRMKA